MQGFMWTGWAESHTDNLWLKTVFSGICDFYHLAIQPYLWQKLCQGEEIVNSSVLSIGCKGKFAIVAA